MAQEAADSEAVEDQRARAGGLLRRTAAGAGLLHEPAGALRRAALPDDRRRRRRAYQRFLDQFVIAGAGHQEGMAATPSC